MDMTVKFKATDDQRMKLDARVGEIKEYLSLRDGSPLNPELVLEALTSSLKGLRSCRNEKEDEILMRYRCGVLFYRR